MKTSYQDSEIGILFDLHDTLVDSRSSWLVSLNKLLPMYNQETLSALYDKMSRKDLCQYMSIDYDRWLGMYHHYLKINYELFAMALKLSTYYRCFIVTNASCNRISHDLTLLQPFVFERVYTKEDGRKPDKYYLSKILEENSLSLAILIGNNLEEDCVDCLNINSVILTPEKNINQIKLEVIAILQKYTANSICDILD